ncbi:MAG: hypothetical protein ACJ8R9_24395 [Steroidobacteraceae bacterium]
MAPKNASERVRQPRRRMMANASSSTYVDRGKTTHFEVSYLASLGDSGIRIADAMLASCEMDYAKLSAWFGGVVPAGLPFQVRLTDDKTGASHPSCASTLISVGANSAPGAEMAFMRSLLFAEVAEVLMHKQNLYWDCGASNGEALSRVLAADLCLGSRPLPANFVSAPTWLAKRSQNWIDTTEMTDSNEVANGCGVLFLNWLRFSQGYSWNQIVAAGADTLAGVYQKLTGNAGAWPAFQSVMEQMFPPNQPVTLKTDNPFRPEAFASVEGSPSPPAHVDPGITAATSQAVADAFSRVLSQLRAERAIQSGDKPYLFPDGINDIEFEFKLSATEDVAVKIKVSGK